LSGADDGGQSEETREAQWLEHIERVLEVAERLLPGRPRCRECRIVRPSFHSCDVERLFGFLAGVRVAERQGEGIRPGAHRPWRSGWSHHNWQRQSLPLQDRRECLSPSGFGAVLIPWRDGRGEETADHGTTEQVLGGAAPAGDR
jgi:hypothetical protein